MKSFVINLERSEDRRKHVLKEFSGRGIEFEFSTGKDRLELSQDDYNEFSDPQCETIDWSHPIVPGLLACWISHQTIWKECLKDDSLDLAAIFEDDVLIGEKFDHAIKLLESNKHLFDIVFLNQLNPNKTFKSVIEICDGLNLGIVKFQNIGAYGYLISRTAMQRLVEQFPKFRDLPIDDILHAPWLTNLRTYTLNPPVVFHRTGHESLIRAPRLQPGKPSIPQEDTITQDWQSNGYIVKMKRRWLKRAWYFRNTIGK